jgi:hypothetical protein
LPSDEKIPSDKPIEDVAIADTAPELVEADELVLAAVAVALVATLLVVAEALEVSEDNTTG